ncbi:Heme A synthase [Pseudobythopirellula maris]|uniref:Heme A synthase n=1 Tax=Pseudobythopirellula maris TaxID=2527991 RepID=A0A5C5ZJD9_9BACT|nr:COX15/CtaA family protein [Pseudobythopirellula maris]TWT87280.1 Heme A synthase [Pseudobythopirellula maris]
MGNKNSTPSFSPWPPRVAWLLCCATFPLLWVGGLVTTTDAGMAVPDWPSTYGYNLFLYPWNAWLYGPWDLFIEHGHRLLASGVGMVTILLAVLLYRCDDRRWMRRLGVAAVLLVIAQGVLGGLRVTENARFLAMIHGCTGPLFFALTVFLAVCSTPRWRRNSSPGAEITAEHHAAGRLARLAIALPAVVYFQLTLGAAVRHVSASSTFASFAMHIKLHLLGAATVAMAVVWFYLRSRGEPDRPAAVKLVARRMVILLLFQVYLGAATWQTKYGLPRWAKTIAPATMEAHRVGGWWATHRVTFHGAGGSLLLGLSTANAAVCWGRRRALLASGAAESSRGQPAPATQSETIPIPSPSHPPEASP